MWNEYRWIVVVGAFLAVFTAYGIGANDLANAFGSSVGSRALTIKQAVLIAGIFEFLGAFLLGSHVTDTVRKKIAKIEHFYDAPEIYMYGMLCVIAACGIWLLVATYLELPVSTTHSAVGGVIGFALTARGADAVVWAEDADDFPYFKGVAAIVFSWVFSPVCSGGVSAVFFFFTRMFVLQHENSYERSFWAFPIMVGIAVFVNAFFIINKGAKSIKAVKNMEQGKAAWISAVVGVGATILAIFVAKFLLKRIVERDIVKREQEAAEKAAGKKADTEEQPAGKTSFFKSLSKGVNEDVHEVVEEDDNVGAVHEFTTEYDAKTEESFKYLQVFTAICDSFSHGANDVANSIGPFAAIYLVYKVEKLKSKTDDIEDDMYWILALGGAGIVLGLSTYGYIIMRAIGVKLCKITPSRGFTIELGSAFIVALGSRYGIPLSTTHCQVGSTIGVGLLEGAKAVNWMIVPKIIVGWVITLIVVGFTTSLLFSQGAYAPSVFGTREKRRLNDYINGYAQEYASRAITLVQDTAQAECGASSTTTQEEGEEVTTWSFTNAVCKDIYDKAVLLRDATEVMFNREETQKVNPDQEAIMLCRVNQLDHLISTEFGNSGLGTSQYGTADYTYSVNNGDSFEIWDDNGTRDFCSSVV